MQGNKGGFSFPLPWFSEFKDFSIKVGIMFIIRKKTILKVNFPVFKIAVLWSKSDAILIQLSLQRMSSQFKVRKRMLKCDITVHFAVHVDDNQ